MVRHLPRGLIRWRAEFWRAAAAAGALAAALALVATTYGVYEIRAAGDTLRTPQFAAAEGPRTTGLSTQFDELPGVGQFSIVLLDPSAVDSPLPPGVERLARGEVILSPALTTYARAHPEQRLDERYGHVVGTIGVEGLTAPDEALVYAVPRAPIDAPQHASGFGVQPGYSPWQVASSSATFGESMQIFGLAYPLLGVVMLVVMPALLLMVSASNVGASPRRRRDAILEALGSSVAFRRWVRVAAGLPGAVLGAGAGATAVCAWVAMSPTVPAVGSQISHEALSPVRAATAALLALIFVCGTWTVSGRQRVKSNRPISADYRLSPWWILTAPAVLWLANSTLWAVRENGTLFSLLGWASSLLCIPAVAVSSAAATSALGMAIRRISLRRGRATGMLAGAWLATQNRRTAVLALTIAGTSLVAFQAAQHALMLTEPGAQGRTVTQQIGSGVARVSLAHGRTTPWADSLSPGQGVIQVRPDGLLGDCRALEALALPCDGTLAGSPLSPKTRALTSALLLPNDAVMSSSSEPLTQAAGTYLVVSTDGQSVSLGDLAVTAHDVDNGVGQVNRVGADWGSGEGYLIQARWITPLTALGLGLALAATLLTGRQSARDLAQQMAGPTSLFAPRRREVLLVTSVVTAIPFALAGLAAGYAARMQAAPMLRKIAVPHALDALTWVVIGSSIAAAVIASSAALLLAWRAVSGWRPGRGA